jgi:hypothetical protein
MTDVPSSGESRGHAPLEREPLDPEPPNRLLAWLSLAAGRRQRRAAPSSDALRRARIATRPLLIAALIAATVALGTWGFRELPLPKPSRLSLIQSLYHALKLYTLEIGPAGGGSVVRPNWQILVALALAVLLVARAALTLLRGGLRRWTTGHLLSGHVIVCGAGVHGSHLARRLSEKHDVVVMDPDASSPGMQGQPGEHEWRLVADAVRPDALLAAGARRANWVVAITGDDFTNSQIVSAIEALAEVRDRLHVLVQLEDPALARFLEENMDTDERGTDGYPSRALRSPSAPRPVVTPFSPNAMAADTLLETAPCKLHGGEAGRLLEVRDGRAPHLILAGDHPLLDAIVLEALRRWRVRILRDLEQPSHPMRPPMRISVYGRDAVARVDRLRRRWLPEPRVLELEAQDMKPEGEAPIEEYDWLAKRAHAGHAIVACVAELDGVRLALGISRALGDGVLMTRVTTQPESLLDKRLRERTKQNRHLATTEVLEIADLALGHEAIGRVGARERLVRALEHDLGEQRARRQSAELFAREQLGIHSDSTWRVLPSERALLRPLVTPIPVSALVRAGLVINLESPVNLRAAAEILSREGQQHDAFTAWCEYARHVNGASPEQMRAGLGARTGDDVADTILRLRAAMLGAPGAPPAPPAGSGVLAGMKHVTIFAGAAATMTSESRSLLEPMLRRALDGYGGAVLSGGTSVGLPGLIGEAARDLGLLAVGYAPAGRGDRALYPTLHETPGAGDFSVREPLSMWCDILDAGIPIQDVRVIACPGGRITEAEVLLARALGAPVAWLDPASDADVTLDDALPFGADGVLELPADAMTLRAFFRWSSAPADLPEDLRDSVARYVHHDYRLKQQGRKPPGDAALAPWNQLLPTLQRSNLAQAEDIPNKLAAVGKRLEEEGGPLHLDNEEVELLAEIEHGRWNVERLRGGWRLGERQISRLVHSDLKPWNELDEQAKDYDREAVRNIAPALAKERWGVVECERPNGQARGRSAYAPDV